MSGQIQCPNPGCGKTGRVTDVRIGQFFPLSPIMTKQIGRFQIRVRNMKALTANKGKDASAPGARPP